MKNKIGAMEMSVGTIVTIVLLMSVLVLGIFLVQKIFKTGTSAIDQVDTKIQSEIDQLFSEEDKSVVVYPKERTITIKKGDSGGFGFSIMNKEQTDGSFSYIVSVGEISSGCQLSEEQAESLIVLGKTGTGINLISGSKLEDAILVKFNIPETAPLCQIRYSLDVKNNGLQYASTVGVDLTIK
ncbi:MAG: hypothetical protein QT10_C0001G0010 [archaeon GW2011_AR19]|nr:MAG: hypothetical protein QT10_C0001G0010 [archaeon GW2011_AR19]